MAPKPVLGHNRSKSNSIFIKKLNRCLVINNNLRKRIEELSDKNKELSRTRNSMLLEKFALQHENTTIRNLNIQLSAKQNIMHRKLSVLEQTIQSCIPSLVTMSQCIPSMLENVHEMSKLEVKELNQEKKEKQTKTVRPIIHGMTITQPTASIQLDMSPIIESPSSSSERTPKSQRRSSFRSSPQCKLSMEPYVRLKDVAAMLKNSKAVPNESPKRRLNESLGEGPSWLNTQENQIQCSNNNINETQYSNSSPRLITSDETQADVPIIASTSSSSMNNTSNETEVRRSDFISSPIDSSMLRNITCRKRNKRSSETSIASDINDSTSSVRPSRSARKKINYKEKSLGCKLRR
ncbi:uncharacterized protein LOC100161044 [Acyrthosiphon pisum]|uniref:Shugoshin C-terminal domain-containing protein n=1 Tax=Acyrthosiphon pisum TaxID=7029 RepID=A0A8R1W722_ACYPI|nr:uncharacterized protein LOC100161044 [Acyrthosiphon pisum]|eukprot:XP_001950989.1 PREDICTED: uncharacterized protein LOC100161044 [Acyrthosiphon pisum]